MYRLPRIGLPWYLAVWAVTAAGDLCSHFLLESEASLIFHRLFLVTGTLTILNVASYLPYSKRLTESCFFVYAVHYPLCIALTTAVGAVFHSASFWQVQLLYVVWMMLVLALSVGLFFVLKRLVPTILDVLIGGRGK